MPSRRSSRWRCPRGLRARRGLGRARGSDSPSIAFRIAFHAVVDAAAKSRGAKARRRTRRDDAPEERVGEHALGRRARSGCACAALLGDHEEDAIVHARAPELPLVGHARGRNSSIVSVPIVGTRRTATWEALRLLEGGELRAIGLLLRRIERSRQVDHRPKSFGTGMVSAALAARAREREEEGARPPREQAAGEAGHLAGRAARERRAWSRKSTLALGDRLFVLHREVGLLLVAEEHRVRLGGELAREDVVVLHRLDVAVPRRGDAVLGALELRLQVAEVGVALELRVVLDTTIRRESALEARPARPGSCAWRSGR